MSQHCWIRYVRKPGEAKAAASEIRICQRPPSEANWGKGETITPCFSQFRPADADPFIASRPRHVFKKNIVFRWKKKTKQKKQSKQRRSFQAYVCACTDFTSSIYVSEKLPVHEVRRTLSHFSDWLSAECMYRHALFTPEHTFSISPLNGFPQRLKMNPIWLWAARRLLNLIQWHDQVSPSDSK